MLGIIVQLAAALVVTVVLLAIAEWVAGRFVPPPPGGSWGAGDDFVRTALNGIELAPELNPTPLVLDAYVLWWNKPLARKTQPVNPRVFGTEGVWTIANNSEGYRGPERPYRNRPDAEVYRILCVGDSVTFGFNVDQEDAYPNRLAVALRERFPDRAIEVINAGVPGWSWVQGLRFLQARGLRLHPNLVIAAHGTNDQFFLTVVSDSERLPVAGAPAPEVGGGASFFERTNTYRALLRLFGKFDRDRCRAQIAANGDCRRVSVAGISSSVREMYHAVQSAGSDFIALNMDFTETPAVTGLRRAVDQDGLRFIDFVDRFRTMRMADEDARADRLGVARAGSTGPCDAPHRTVFRVFVGQPADEVSVWGLAYGGSDFAFSEVLHDDGTHGDEVAGDHVFSGTVEIPAEVPAVEYKYWTGDTAEFTPLPPMPSRFGARFLWTRGAEVFAPVVVFGDHFLMAERTHPNPRGTSVIAAGVLDAITSTPSFVAWTR
jgi:lysophospholipase L1-like esterase